MLFPAFLAVLLSLAKLLACCLVQCLILSMLEPVAAVFIFPAFLAVGGLLLSLVSFLKSCQLDFLSNLNLSLWTFPCLELLCFGLSSSSGLRMLNRTTRD